MKFVNKEDAIRILEEKQKELCQLGAYGRNYVCGTDRVKFDELEEMIKVIDGLPCIEIDAHISFD